MQFNSMNDVKIKETRYDIKEIIFGFIFKFFEMLFSVTGVVMQVSQYISTGNFVILTYFTIISNIIITIFCALFMVLDIIRLYTRKDYRKNWLYTLKYCATVGITVTMLVYVTLIMPMSFGSHMHTDMAISNILVHVLTPIFAILDFFLCDYSFESKKYYAYFPCIYLYLYLIFVFILSAVGVRWGSTNSGSSDVTPYTFINYELNGWFTFDLSSAEIMKGKTGIGVFYMIIIVTLLVILLSLIFLRIKNKNQLRKYNITLKENTYYTGK